MQHPHTALAEYDNISCDFVKHAVIGVHDRERVIKQPIEISLTLSTVKKDTQPYDLSFIIDDFLSNTQAQRPKRCARGFCDGKSESKLRTY
jgi:hypothetical protein